MFGRIILYVSIGLIIFFSLPSTAAFFIFLGVFKVKENETLDNMDLTNTQYEPYKDIVCSSIKRVKLLPYQEIMIESFDHLKLKADYYNTNSSKLAILFHGYRAKPLSNFSIQIESLMNKGFDVLLVYERGHGKSEGKFTTCGIKEKKDVLKWIDWADQNKCVSDILIYGMSLGSTALAYASSEIKSPKVKVLVFDCGFSCFYDEMKHKNDKKKMINLGFIECTALYAKIFLKIDMIKSTTNDSLINNNIPSIFFHGENDPEVPLEIGKHNYEICPAEKIGLFVPKAGHTTSFLYGGEKVENEFYEFINKFIK